MLVPSVQQCESATSIHTSSSSWASLPLPSGHPSSLSVIVQICQNVLCIYDFFSFIQKPSIKMWQGGNDRQIIDKKRVKEHIINTVSVYIPIVIDEIYLY